MQAVQSENSHLVRSLYDVGERDVPAWLLLKGSIAVLRRDGLQHEAALTNLGLGQFTGEVSQLVGAMTLASVYAGHEGCTALLRCNARAAATG